MFRCYLKRSLRTAVGLILAVMMVFLLRQSHRQAVLRQFQFPSNNLSTTLRFWSLVNGSSQRVYENFMEGPLPSLWSPEVNSTSLPLEDRDDDRILSQLKWGMEAALANFTGNSWTSQTKRIYLTGSFSSWYRSEWQDPHYLEAGECYGKSVLNCSFTTESQEGLDAVVSKGYFKGPKNVLTFHYRLESPVHTSAHLGRSNDLLASFYRGSDINTPYGKWVYYDPEVRFKDQEKNYTAGKSKMAAIFTSNCGPHNNRLGYVRELQKYVEVDVFGSCGPKRCPRFEEKECFDMLKKDYLFYLSFENSNCRDYITEKLYLNAFENDVIPIVLGAHPSDYKVMCPDHSYIHVEDFPSPEELASYMLHLASSPEEYNSYFRWRGTGTFIDTQFLCRICALVHYADVVPPPKRKKPVSWRSGEFNGKKMCLSSGNWYWNRSETN